MIAWDSSDPLLCLTHLDGRNSQKTQKLRTIFSEYAWIELRVKIILRYLQAVSKQKNISVKFDLSEARKIKQTEKTLNHDLKAIEVWITRQLTKQKLTKLIPQINLGLGSEDINNLALNLQLKQSREEVLWPELQVLLEKLRVFSAENLQVSMLARTHAQVAGITTLSKELAIPLSRLCDEIEIWKKIEFWGKLSGETGTFEGLYLVNPKLKWLKFSDQFIQDLGLKPQHLTTQIAPYDQIIRYLASLQRINLMLIDFCQNCWLNVLLGYFQIVKVEQEVGSAGMPHKVNPIYFEGAEGNLIMANGLISTFTDKLMLNRLQRDFSDSTLRRNLVLVIAYSLLAWQSLHEGLNRLKVNQEKIKQDLAAHGEALVETIKILALSEGKEDVYWRLKKSTRGRSLSLVEVNKLIESENLSEPSQQKINAILKGGQINPALKSICEETYRRVKQIIKL